MLNEKIDQMGKVFTTEFGPYDGHPFYALRKAEAFLQKFGYSYGSLCGDEPCGIMLGEVTIAKWENLTEDERSAVDGMMTSNDFRNGSVKVTIKNFKGWASI